MLIFILLLLRPFTTCILNYNITWMYKLDKHNKGSRLCLCWKHIPADVHQQTNITLMLLGKVLSPTEHGQLGTTSAAESYSFVRRQGQLILALEGPKPLEETGLRESYFCNIILNGFNYIYSHLHSISFNWKLLYVCSIVMLS